ncbi:hypothetical protein Moror_1320 [Moniliophthora roreri MCA 2997]|uniref:Uncharacterized protein n=2 Tax=Moniliophthora roreri TaxID=221103 RepID=V2W271_MONRO|nr:hypothetical protein Moror_1320 [Moniliophthora roreri MCA 2997]KAI3599095.1 hypothetical protein WG66_004026 [Moniliophthora roreri]
MSNLSIGPLLSLDIYNAHQHSPNQKRNSQNQDKKRYSPTEENVDQRLGYLKSVTQPLCPCYLPHEALGFTTEASFDAVYTHSEGIPQVIVKYPIKKNTWTSSSRALKDGVVILEDRLTRWLIRTNSTVRDVDMTGIADLHCNYPEIARTPAIRLAWSPDNLKLSEAWRLQGSGKVPKVELGSPFRIDTPVFKLKAYKLNLPHRNTTKSTVVTVSRNVSSSRPSPIMDFFNVSIGGNARLNVVHRIRTIISPTWNADVVHSRKKLERAGRAE